MSKKRKKVKKSTNGINSEDLPVGPPPRSLGTPLRTIPVTLRGMIMAELRDLYSKRNGIAENSSSHSTQNKGDEYNNDKDRLPPKPAEDLPMAPQVKFAASIEKFFLKNAYYCQYCGRQLSEEEHLTHCCKIKPE